MSAAGPLGNSAPATPPPRPPSPTRHVLYSVGILICGMIIGSALTAHFGHRMMMRALDDPDKMGERLHRRLNRDLDLSAEQDRKIGAIISAHSAAVKAIMNDNFPRVRVQFDRMHDEIRAELSPEQAKKWDERYERMKKRFGPAAGLLPPPPPDE